MLLLSFSCSCATNQSCTLPLMVVLFLELISSKFCQAFYCCWILHHVAGVIETLQHFIPKHRSKPSSTDPNFLPSPHAVRLLSVCCNIVKNVCESVNSYVYKLQSVSARHNQQVSLRSFSTSLLFHLLLQPLKSVRWWRPSEECVDSLHYVKEGYWSCAAIVSKEWTLTAMLSYLAA